MGKSFMNYYVENKMQKKKILAKNLTKLFR